MMLFQQPGEEDFAGVVAENAFISDIQVAIENALSDRSITQTDLAKMLGVSSARVSQILGGNGANLTARTVAKIAHALGLRACVTFADTCLDGWWQESQDDQEPATEFADWVRVAVETLEEEGIKPAAPSNDTWKGGAEAQAPATIAESDDELVAA